MLIATLAVFVPILLFLGVCASYLLSLFAFGFRDEDGVVSPPMSRRLTPQSLAPLTMKRFGIFKKLADGTRAFVSVSDEESSAKTEAIRLKEQTGWDHLVFNLGAKKKRFDTGLYDRHLKRWNDTRNQKIARNPF